LTPLPYKHNGGVLPVNCPWTWGNRAFILPLLVLQETKDGHPPADVIQEDLVIRLPTQDVDKLFETVLMWGRFAELIGYSPETTTVFLDQPSDPSVQTAE
jgi:AAA domain-containing protein